MSKAQKKRANPLFRLLVVGFTCYAVFAMVGLQVEIGKRQREIKELEDKCTQQEIDNKEIERLLAEGNNEDYICLLYTSPSPRDLSTSRMPSSA